MKITALDSFASAETGMVHAGQEIDASQYSQDRLDYWAERGFIAKVKMADAPLNKAEAPPSNKSDPAPLSAKTARKGKNHAR